MDEPYIQNLFAQRIGGNQYGKSNAIYKFEKIKRAKQAALSANPGKEIIDMGVGEPDEMAYPGTLEVLSKEARKPVNRGYADNGGPELKEAAADYLQTVFQVEGIDPQSHILHSIGSKAALSILPTALIDPGDFVLMTTPGYPIFGTHARYYGGLIHSLPIHRINRFLPQQSYRSKRHSGILRPNRRICQADPISRRSRCRILVSDFRGRTTQFLVHTGRNGRWLGITFG